jgi:hypothetical protein
MSSDFDDKQAVVLASSPTKRQLAARSRRTKLILHLSREAKQNLEKLRLKSLDKRGRKPGESQIIEELINTALKNEPEAPYPANKKSP